MERGAEFLSVQGAFVEASAQVQAGAIPDGTLGAMSRSASTDSRVSSELAEIVRFPLRIRHCRGDFAT